MKNRVVGSVAVGAVILGIYLANFWKGPGLGGSGTETMTAPSNIEETNVSTSLTPASRPSDPQAEEGNEQFVTVVVHDDQYRLSTYEEPETGMDVSLDTIVSRAGKVSGNDKGVKVWILLERSAQEGAIADLHRALADAGVAREAIIEPSGFVD